MAPLAWNHLILPALTLGIRPLAVVIQLTRNSAVDVLGMSYVRTARSKGISSFRLLTHHVVRNALNPVLDGRLRMVCEHARRCCICRSTCLVGVAWDVDVPSAGAERSTCGTRLCFGRCSHLRCHQHACRCRLRLARPTRQDFKRELSSSINDLEVVLKYRLVR